MSVLDESGNCVRSVKDMEMDRDWTNFRISVENRLHKGSLEYGDESIERPTLELLSEVQEELADVCGWSYILWRKLERLREKVR